MKRPKMSARVRLVPALCVAVHFGGQMKPKLRPCWRCTVPARFSLCTVCAVLYRVLPWLFTGEDPGMPSSYWNN